MNDSAPFVVAMVLLGSYAALNWLWAVGGMSVGTLAAVNGIVALVSFSIALGAIIGDSP
jgi:Na+/alanine symporter